MDIEVGTRIVGTSVDQDGNEAIFENTGTVAALEDCYFLVQWDTPNESFHTGSDRVPDNTGWWISYTDNCFEILEEDQQNKGSVIEKRCRKLWNRSKFVKVYPKLSY